jgi:hypothetical protein
MAATLTNIFYTPAEQKRIARIVFSLILLSLTGSFFSNTLIHQLHQPVVKFPNADPTYWLLHALQIPETITSHYAIACVFDIALFAFCLLSLLYPHRHWFIISFSVLFFVYVITFNTYGTHHTNHKIGVLFITLPFWVRNNKSFNFCWQALRYFLLFAFSSAFVWKFLRFSWLQPDEGILILKKNIAPYLYFNPHSTLVGVYTWLLQHAGVTQALYLAGTLLEAVFIIGFFTKKADGYLFIASVLLVIGFWFMADAYMFELLILTVTLLNFHRWGVKKY